jgi:hypothetical protein
MMRRLHEPGGYGWRLTLPRAAWPAVHEHLVMTASGKYAVGVVDGQVVVSVSRQVLDGIDLPTSAQIEKEQAK